MMINLPGAIGGTWDPNPRFRRFGLQGYYQAGGKAAGNTHEFDKRRWRSRAASKAARIARRKQRGKK